MKTPFEILGITDSVTDEQVKSAYLKKIREFPPERFPQKFKEIKSAFERIKTQRDRVGYKLFHLEEPNMENFLDTLKQRSDKRIQSEKLLQFIEEAAREKIKAV